MVADETEGKPPVAETLIAAAPHPTEGTNNPDAVIHSPVPVPSGATLRLLLPEGQNPSWLAEALHAATGAKVEAKTYATDAEAVAAVTGEAPPDLVSLSDRAAAVLIAKGALRVLPPEDAKGPAAPAPEFLHHYFDPKNAYTWPYGYTLLGIATAAPADPKAFAPRTWRDLTRPDLALSMPSDPALKEALWALAEAKPALSDTPPEAWQKAPYEAAPASVTPGKAWVDTMARLRLLHPGAAIVPAEGSLIFLYHWAIPAAASVQAAPAEAALRALAEPATAARFDADAGLAPTQPAARQPGSADSFVSFSEHALNDSRFVRVPEGAPAATAAAAATSPR